MNVISVIFYFVFVVSQALFAQDVTSYDLKIKEGKNFKERLYYPEAIRCFEEAIKLAPTRPEAFSCLAGVYEKKEEYDKAILYWGKASHLAPQDKTAKEHFIFLNIIKKRNEFLKKVTLPEKLEKMHFIIYHDNYLYASKLIFKAEAAYSKILHDLGLTKFPFWDRFKCVILLFPKKEDYLSASSAPSWSEGLAQYHIFLFSTFEGAPKLEEKTLPHELSHMALQMFMGSGVRIPLWLNEGMAQYEEHGSKDYLNYIKHNIPKNNFFPMADLFEMNDYPADQEKIYLYYSQSASVVYYLKDKSIATCFYQLLRKIRDGVGMEDALKESYQWKFRGGIADLEKRWLEELR